MWRWRRRQQREDRIKGLQAQGDAEMAMMRRQLDDLLRICASVGASVSSAASDAVDGVPPGLIVANRVRHHRPGGEPVYMRGPRSGKEAIAVVGAEGNPAAWWAAIMAKAGACQA